MGCDTRLHVSSKWRLNEIVQVMENHLTLEERPVYKSVRRPDKKRKVRIKEMKKVVIKPCLETSPDMLTFHFKVIDSEYEEGRMMFVHLNVDTPLGPCTLLSLGMNDEAISIMRAIAMVLGGYLEENDCEGTGEMITGAADDRSDGLLYFVTSGIKEGKFGNKEQCTDDLKEYMDEWNKEYGRGGNE